MSAPARAYSGLSPAAKALLIADAAAHETARAESVVLVVVANDAEVDRMAGDVRFFLAALEGLAESDVERAVLPFPSHEVEP